MQINNKASLSAAIFELEQKKIVLEGSLKTQFETTRESLKPVNLIKEGISSFTETPKNIESLFQTLAGIGVGLFSKKLFVGKSHSIIKTLFGTLVEFAATNTTISNADKIKAYGISIYNNLFRKKENHVPEGEEKIM